MHLSPFLVYLSFLGTFSLWACQGSSFSSISREEYEVYSAFFSQWHFYHPPVGESGEVQQVEVEAIGMTMSYDFYSSDVIHRGDDKAARLGPPAPPFGKLDSSIFSDYMSKADAPIDFKRIDVPSNVTIKATDGYYSYTLSRIGFNESMDVATFFVHIPNLGGSWFVFKFLEGRWQLDEEVTIWVE